MPRRVTHQQLTQQPQDFAEADWSNPLTAGLTVLNVGNSRINLVDGSDQAEGGEWPSVVTPGGIAMQSATAIRGRYWHAPQTPRGQSTIFCAGVAISGGTVVFGSYAGPQGENTGYLLAIDAGAFRLYTYPGYSQQNTTTPAQDSVFTCAAVGDPTNQVQGWLNGQPFGSTLTIFGTNLGRAGPSQILTSQAQNDAASSLVFASWARSLSPAELRSLHDNPWQLFAPRRIWVPQSAGGGGAASVAPARIESTASVRAPVVARTSVVAVAPARIASTANVRAPTVARVAVAAVAPARLASTANVRTPLVSRVAVSAVSPGRIASTAVVRSPSLARLAVASVTAARFGPTSVVRSPAVSADGIVAISPARIQSTASVRGPVVFAAGVRSVSAPRIASTAVVASPAVARQAVVAAAPARIESSASFGAPTISSSNVPQIIVGRIQSTALVRAPAVQRVGSGGGADPAEVWSYVLADGRTAEQTLLDTNRMMRIVMAALSGQTAGVGTATETYFGEDGVTPRLVATFDGQGNRVTVVTNGAP